MHQFVEDCKQQWLTSVVDPSLLERVCREAGMTWRERLLPPVLTLRLFLLQILHGNVACTALPHLSQRKFTASAYCSARKRIPLTVFTQLLRAFTQAAVDSPALAGNDRWRGHRVWLVDGTGCSTPDTRELQAPFGQPKLQQPGCGFPVVYGLALMHWGSGLIQEWLAAPQPTSEARLLAKLHTRIAPHDLVVGDENYGYFGHVALLWQRGTHVLFRLSKKRIVDFTPGRPYTTPESWRRHDTPGLPRARWRWQWHGEDQVVDWFKPWQSPAGMPRDVWQSMPKYITLRELRYRVACPGFRSRQITLVTTLLNTADYPASALAELYAQRWQIETNFRHLKITLGMDELHCHTVAGVLKEMTMYCLVYNLVRVAMGLAAKAHAVPLEEISFKDAWRWLMCGSHWQSLSWILLLQIRPHRIEPRVQKRRLKKYPLLKQPRDQLRKTLTTQTLPA